MGVGRGQEFIEIEVELDGKMVLDYLTCSVPNRKLRGKHVDEWMYEEDHGDVDQKQIIA